MRHDTACVFTFYAGNPIFRESLNFPGIPGGNGRIFMV